MIQTNTHINNECVKNEQHPDYLKDLENHIRNSELTLEVEEMKLSDARHRIADPNNSLAEIDLYAMRQAMSMQQQWIVQDRAEIILLRDILARERMRHNSIMRN